jgi:hypothetical protein
VERHHRAHGTYPPDVTALAAAGATEMHGWAYTPGADGYALTSKLGWDPSLRYVVEGGGAQWVFVPGDGSPEKTIDLRP